MGARLVLPESLGSNLGQQLRVWCLQRDHRAYFESVERWFGPKATFVYDEQWDPAAMSAGEPDIVLCVNDWPYDVACCLDAAREQGIPSLVLQDGILEWRCQYENPLFGVGGGAPQHQPVLADKIACMGAQSARQIAAWGNSSKVEITGMPRLDYLLERKSNPAHSPVQRVLVMTAKNPGFTPAQREVTIRSLMDVKLFLDTRPDFQVSWRVGQTIAETLGVSSGFGSARSEELAAQHRNAGGDDPGQAGDCT